ncbi:M1 family aminopeptidase [Chitinophaga caseinilytica]|uniref:M1 family aminopeptidase n=1 Tax=Chitinophaga caseinilytica TaxID=2267521 RepID=UPI003C2AADC8
MLTKLLAFETGYHFRQSAWWLAAVAFLGLGLVTVRGNFGGDEVHRNAPYAISVVVALLSLCSVFAATVFSAGALLRDKTFRMDALVFSTAIGKARYFGVKFGGLFIAVFTLLCLAAIGIWLGSLTLEPSMRGPFVLHHYLQPLLVFGLPNVLFTCGILFALAMRTWDPKMVYAGGVLLYILYLTASIAAGSPLLAGSNGTGQSLGAILSDPYGLAPFFGGTRYWTYAQRNTELYPLSGALLVNRGLWALLTAGLMWIVYRRFRLSASNAASKAEPAQEAETDISATYVTAYTQTSGVKYWISAFRARLGLEVRAVCLHVPFLLMMGLWAFYMFVELNGSLRGLYGIQTIPGSGQIAQHLISVRPAILLIIFYAAELVFAERSSRIDGIIGSTPLPAGILWAGKAASLAVMAVSIVTVNVVTGIVVQMIHGVLPLRLDIYASLYWYAALPLALHGVLAIFVLTVVRRKFMGMMICLIVILPVLFGSRFGTEHPMLRFALPQHFKWSDMDGFGRVALAHGWWMLYWGALAVLMGVLSVRAWQHGVKGWFRGWDTAGAGALVASLVVFMAAGGYIHRQMHAPAAWQSDADAEKWQADYEMAVAPLKPAFLPDIMSINTQIDLFPETGRYIVKGEYIIRNNTTGLIDTLLTGVSPEVRSWNISIDNAQNIGKNDLLQIQRFLLQNPLRPGDSLRVRFRLEADRSGFVPFNPEHSVARNGSYIELDKHLPYFGYNAGYALSDRPTRAKFHLTETVATAPPDTQYHRIRYTTLISTAAGQTALAPGQLKRRWQKDNRAYFEYATDGPAPDGLAISSARYAEKTLQHRGRNITVYYHPGHSVNVSAILEGMQAALDYCDTNYAAYPTKNLTLAEIPVYPGAATAYPTLMFAKESVLFTADYSDTAQINHAFATAAHETAHQWWAGLLTPQGDSSYKFLTETMAKHIEGRVLEHRFGRDKHLQYLAADRQYYFGMRSGKELPLVRSADQNWVHYQKGALAMDTLTQLMGETRVNAGMRELFQRYTPPNGRPTAEMLMQIWERGASGKEKELLERWFRKVEDL